MIMNIKKREKRNRCGDRREALCILVFCNDIFLSPFHTQLPILKKLVSKKCVCVCVFFINLRESKQIRFNWRKRDIYIHTYIHTY